MISEALFSSQKDNWETPQDFFDELDNEFHFTLDPCSDDQNYKCEYHFTKDDDGLSKDWGGRRYSATRHTEEDRRDNGYVSAMKSH